MTGYLHPDYAWSLCEFGLPRAITRSQGYILERPIGESGWRDAMGPYPLYCCRDWSGIEADLATLSGDLVSLALVTDPFGNFDEASLRKWFDVVVPFKKHFLVDLKRNPLDAMSKHHRYYARRALETVRVDMVDRPLSQCPQWVELYDVLIRRHELRGVKAFSPESFRRQLGVPGMVMLRAESEGETVGMHLWYVQGDVAYSHLMALSERGYELSASYALYQRAIELFSEISDGPIAWLNIGAGAGLAGSNDGLTRFKAGWANDARIAYFVGKILDRDRYEQLVRQHDATDSRYFPAYRHGEFA
jgi:hypothetical protein